MEAPVVVAVILLDLAFCYVGGKIWQGKGGSFAVGFAVTFFFGILGFLIMVIYNPGGGSGSPPPGPRAVRDCPFCTGPMRRDARACPHCRSESDPWTYSDRHWWVRRGGDFYYLDERAGAWVRHEPVDVPEPPS